MIPLGTLRRVITEEIEQDFPECGAQDYICLPDLTKYRMQYVHSLLNSEQGEVSNLENDVLQSMQHHDLINKNIESKFDQNWTFGERLADKIASFGGSWTFLICFAGFYFFNTCFNCSN